ncbi:MAG: hypothetical protein ACKO9Q_18655, partial [Pirellula sp.]
IGTRVTTLAAQSSTGIYIQEADGVTIDLVNVSVDRVNFNSTKTAQSQTLEDLTTTNNGPVKLQSLTGNIVVNPGTTGTNGISANGTGDILLQALAGGIVANANIESGSGDITLSSQDALVIGNRIRTAAPGSIVLESQGSVTIGQSSSFETNGANLGVFSGGEILIGSINAATGKVFLDASTNIREINTVNGATNITASSVSMKAGGRIGNVDT